MGYPRQDPVNKRLHKETLDALEKTGSKGMREMGRLWRDTRKELQLAIMNSYRLAAPRGEWNITAFRHHAQSQLAGEVRSALEQFRALSTQAIKKNLNVLYRQSWGRYAWMLDQLTPPSRKVIVPQRYNMHESDNPKIYQNSWADKWSQWVDSYHSALLNNVAMGASNGSSISDAVGEVDATRSNTPQSTLEDAMTRIYDYAATQAMVEGANDISDLNTDTAEEEIWKTRGDLNVCDDCAELEGQLIDDIGEWPPLHPNCHCYPKVVPKLYAQLLRSGNQDDRDLARDMHRAGLDDSSLVVRDEGGDIVAKAIIGFSKWASGNGFAIRAQ